VYSLVALAAWSAFLGRSVVGCASPAHPPDAIDSPETRLPRVAGPGYDPGCRGISPGS
jgi:hypothetical protein